MTGIMAGNEFDIIQHYFSFSSPDENLLVAVGDDAAVIQPENNEQLVMATDTLVAGVHFPESTSPEDIAYKSIAVNLSDLAAMGATPRWVLLSLTVPNNNTDWLQRFAQSFEQTCAQFAVKLIGGDTTRGPLSVTVQATGVVAADHSLRRNNAKAGDHIMVTGTLGDAALALELLETNRQHPYLLQRLNRPQPRLEFAKALNGHCRCAIDVSDGLIADLSHITEMSGCGAELYLEAIPLSEAYRNCCEANTVVEKLTKALTGGDDYELCITVSSEKIQYVTKIAAQLDVNCVVLGKITTEPGIRCIDENGQLVAISATGYKHF